MRARVAWPLAVLVLLAPVAACTGDDDDSAGPTTTSPSVVAGEPCAKENLVLKDPGVLTVATDFAALPPWFAGDPNTGEGFESALTYAVAGALGFAREEVTWTAVLRDDVVTPGPKPFDLDVDHITITDEAARAVDFSDGYFELAQVVVGLTGSAAAGATSVEDLRPLRLGTLAGNVVQAGSEPTVYPDPSAALTGLQAGEIDAVLVDLPTGLLIADVEGTTMIGRLPATGEGQQLGMVFERGSPLRQCVDEALGHLRSEGELERLEARWLADVAELPTLAP